MVFESGPWEIFSAAHSLKHDNFVLKQAETNT